MGGIGFAGLGHTAGKNSLEQKPQHRRIDENPYLTPKTNRNASADYQELKRWRDEKERKTRKLQFWIRAGIGISLISWMLLLL